MFSARGQMGNGIAHVFAQHGYRVVVFDIVAAQLENALKDYPSEPGAAGQEGHHSGVAGRRDAGTHQTTRDMADLAGVDFAVEAVTEHEPLKLDIFRELDGVAKDGVVLASNTSSIPITKIASVTKRPTRSSACIS